MKIVRRASFFACKQGNLQAERELIYEETRSAIGTETKKTQQLQVENYQLRNKIAEMLDVMRRAVSAEGNDADVEQEVCCCLFFLLLSFLPPTVCLIGAVFPFH